MSIQNVKISVTAPLENINDIRDAMAKAGAGVIGNYSYCSITSKCIGTFKGNNNSDPYFGEKNKVNIVEEIKLEMICDISIAKEVIKKIRIAHPYEEPAIEIIPLLDEKDFQ
ncbi:MAG: hypothetical protein GX265_03940 [Mollicutes bacterium]|jgi:hypothetical protein|nr:hypothetical protein [Mollicutes bacterium]